MMQLPENVDCLREILMRLATNGGARVPVEWQEWLLSVGVAARTDGTIWLSPTHDFLSDVIPARDELDLLRRVTVRDPMYRFHLDLSLISVIHSVAAAERWQRLDELLFNSCRSIAPRLMQILEWEIARTGRAARQLTDADWKRTHESILKDEAAPFFKWDNQLWGECRGPSELFPLLLSLYLPLCQLPVCLAYSESADEASGVRCLASLVKAAGEGEGVELPRDRIAVIRNLQDHGVPVRLWDLNNSHCIASLVIPVTFQSILSVSSTDYSPAPASVPVAARSSYSIRLGQERIPSRLSAFAEGATTIALCSLPPDCSRWPAKSPIELPEWMPLPGADDLATSGKRRIESPAVDQALRDLAEHPLYGLVLQLLLLEALDRELGEETVILSPPLNRRIESFEHWAETVVLYRPRDDTKENIALPPKGFHLLGRCDEVFGKVARKVGIVKVASSLEKGSATPWSKALALMSTADLVVGKQDRWTITPQILDRLHSGALMKDIIRQGRVLRDKMHSVFVSLWQEQAGVPSKEAFSA